jgi:hypothetical protein
MRRIFWGFCINRFGIGPLHYISSHSDFGFEFAEIFIIEKQLPDSLSRGVDKNAYGYNFFKPLNKSMVIVHPWLLFYQIDLLEGWFSHLKFRKSMINLKNFEQRLPDSP